MDFDFLLKEYRSIWNNRLLSTAEVTNSEQVLKEAIKRELLDENSHPRIRRNRFEKYYFSIKRVTDSSISTEAKLSLTKVHNELMEELKEGV
ncbi:hypothetical protein [Neobacillus sp. PS3-40]|uniref:hypothetical protein n=1 Tax=Neobacillus sp. PS3-40 TaxID=3070679 RepID=UPI0027E0D720|nr:hypothetical protein [Neobacillus sp. PS3-40]WML44986.1 hypothetical protein RCG20_03520 [Neobacillus sp. PS3-40]